MVIASVVLNTFPSAALIDHAWRTKQLLSPGAQSGLILSPGVYPPAGAAANSSIFSGASSSAPQSTYSQASSVESTPSATNQVFQEPVPRQQTQEAVLPPPPFEEDNRKKYVIIAIFGIVLLFIIFLIISFLSSRFRTKTVSGPITLTYWGLWTEKEVMQPIIDDYQKSHPTVKINYIFQDKKLYRERLTAAIDRGEGPDIFRFHNSWGIMIEPYLKAVPKTIYSDAEFSSLFYPVVTEDLKKSDGNYYGIPLSIDGLVLFYNEDILKGANINVPVTWDKDFDESVRKMTVVQGDRVITAGAAIGLSENVEHFSDIVGLLMLQNRTKISESLSKCLLTTTPKEEVSSDTNCGYDALAFYHSYAEKPNPVWDERMENSITAFAQEKVAIIFAPTWEVAPIKAMNPALNFKIAKVPQLSCETEPCPSTHWASYWVEGVSNRSKYSSEAFDFLKYLSSKEVLQKKYEAETSLRKLFGELPSRTDMAETFKSNQYLKPLVEEAPFMKSYYFSSRTQDGETGVNTRINKYLGDAITSLGNGTSPETALSQIQNGITQVLGSYKPTPMPTIEK
jgi:multiple sugar transport system substrate-binding protein